MTAAETALADRPRRDALAVVHLRERDAGGGDHLLHRGPVRDGGVDVLVERLEQDARAVRREAAADETFGVGQLSSPASMPTPRASRS